MEEKSLFTSKKGLAFLICLGLVTLVAAGYAFIDPTSIPGIFTTYTTFVGATLGVYLGSQATVDHRLAKNREKPVFELPFKEESFESPTEYREVRPPPLRR